MNNVKEKYKNGKKTIGNFCVSCSESMVEAIALAGFDYVVIDNEHSPVAAETTAAMIRAAECHGLTPFCRVSDFSRPGILKLLDVGAQGLIIPHVKTVEDVKQIVEHAKYKPIGDRGFCPSRKDGWGYKYGFGVPETLEYFNEDVMVFPQCETVGALENIEEIAAMDGVDGIFVGPYDLSVDMGIPGELDNPIHKQAVSRVLTACHNANKPCILFAMTEDRAKLGFEQGFDSVSLGLDTSIYIEAAMAKIAKCGI